jgi:hypothetical protein
MAPVWLIYFSFFNFWKLFWVTFCCNVCRDGLVVPVCWLLGSIQVRFVGGHGVHFRCLSFPLVHKLGKTISIRIGDIFSKSVEIVVCKIPKTHLRFGKGFRV